MYRASSLVSGESLRASKVFPGHAPKFNERAWPPRLLGTCQNIPSPSRYYNPQIFLLNFFVVYYLFIYFLPQLLSTTTGSCNVEKLPLVILNKCLQETGCLHAASSESDQIKLALSGSSREPPSSLNNDSSLRMRLWRSFSPILPPPRGYDAAGFYSGCRILVFKVIMGLEEVKIQIGQIKMPHNSLFLLKLSFFFFFCINSSFIVANFWLISKVLRKVDPDNYASVLIAFIEE